MKILGINSIGKKALGYMVAATTSAVILTSAPIINAGTRLRTDSFERTENPDGSVTITEKKTIVRNKPDETPQKQSSELIAPNNNTKTDAPQPEPQQAKSTTVVTSNKRINPSAVPPKGTTAPEILDQAPNPNVTITGQEKTATIVIDLSTNILYKYDDNGNPEIAYRVASGKKSTPTAEGVRIVTHIETYPYRTAPPTTKRHQNPQDYGPKLIHLLMINPKNGQKWDNGEYIHGNNNASSIGKYASKGCVRMDNEVIKILSSQVEKGDIVVIKKY